MTERRAYSRHGPNALKARVKVRGLQAIGHRTGPGRPGATGPGRAGSSGWQRGVGVKIATD